MSDIPAAFQPGKDLYRRSPNLRCGQLYDFVVGIAAPLGWEFGAPTAGHLIAHLPHERSPQNPSRYETVTMFRSASQTTTGSATEYWNSLRRSGPTDWRLLRRIADDITYPCRFLYFVWARRRWDHYKTRFNSRRSGIFGGCTPAWQGHCRRQSAPTIVRDIPDDARLVREEQFGPVLPVMRYSNLDAAIARANGTEYGLGGTVWGSI